MQTVFLSIYIEHQFCSALSRIIRIHYVIMITSNKTVYVIIDTSFLFSFCYYLSGMGNNQHTDVYIQLCAHYRVCYVCNDENKE